MMFVLFIAIILGINSNIKYLHFLLRILQFWYVTFQDG